MTLRFFSRDVLFQELHQPFLIEVVEESFNVGFKHIVNPAFHDTAVNFPQNWTEVIIVIKYSRFL